MNELITKKLLKQQLKIEINLIRFDTHKKYTYLAITSQWYLPTIASPFFKVFLSKKLQKPKNIIVFVLLLMNHTKCQMFICD